MIATHQGMQIEFIFNQDDYGFMRDHCPEEHPVIPFVSAVDAFYTTLQKHVGPCVLQEIRLVKGIILPDFKTFSLMIHIDEGSKTVQMIGENGVVHYKAAYSFIPEFRITVYPEFQPTSHSKLKGDYEFLFHGPMLHSIVSIQTDKPDNKAIGVLKTATGMEWQKTDWFFDPFACDGALQMGCQLAFMAKQKASLPSKIKTAIFYKKPNSQGNDFRDVTGYQSKPLETVSNQVQNAALDPTSEACSLVQETRNTEVFVHLVFQKMSGLQYVFDAHLFDKDKTPICSLEGIESYFRLFKPVHA